MNKTLISLALLIAALVTGCTNVREVGKINGLDVHRVTTRGIFSPSSTTIVLSDPTKPGTIELSDAAHGPGFLPAVANAAGIAGGAALLRPSSIKQSGGGATSTSGSNSSAQGGAAHSSSASAGGNATGGAGGTANANGNTTGGSTTQNGAVHHNTGNGNGSGNNGNH